jgi:hypothetical protein
MELQDLPLRKGAKYTLVAIGQGMFNSDTIRLVVCRGIHQHPAGPIWTWSEPRGRTHWDFTPVFQRGAILLEGDHVTAPDLRILEQQNDRFIMDHRGGRFQASEPPHGAKALIEHLARHCVAHTLDRCPRLIAVDCTAGASKDDTTTRSIKAELLEALPPPLEIGAPPEPVPVRKSLLTTAQRAALIAAGQSTKPLVRIFDPCGASSWLLCSLDPDSEVLWGFCDLGRGVVEYGTVGLAELETRRPRGGLPLERDKFFDGCDYSSKELQAMSSLPSSLRKPEVVA